MPPRTPLGTPLGSRDALWLPSGLPAWLGALVLVSIALGGWGGEEGGTSAGEKLEKF